MSDQGWKRAVSIYMIYAVVNPTREREGGVYHTQAREGVQLEPLTGRALRWFVPHGPCIRTPIDGAEMGRRGAEGWDVEPGGNTSRAILVRPKVGCWLLLFISPGFQSVTAIDGLLD